ncbi:uncharacterized protein [Periplaneta americana]|uniref:uncharacterized protein isoform X6 n=1 Tax=Periplaneta americana TaxID=6978 RepID=UPI0037E825B7
MDVIKLEPEDDPLAIQTSDTTDADEKKPLSEDGKLVDLHLTEVKTECMDRSFDLKSEITFEETPVPIDFIVVKSEVGDEFCQLDEVDGKVKLEITVEENEVLSQRKEIQ